LNFLDDLETEVEAAKKRFGEFKDKRWNSMLIGFNVIKNNKNVLFWDSRQPHK
jgi:hypothetical protein